eukprot:4472846-Alexandrium_andersonii.AAC.1
MRPAKLTTKGRAVCSSKLSSKSKSSKVCVSGRIRPVFFRALASPPPSFAHQGFGPWASFGLYFKDEKREPAAWSFKALPGCTGHSR